MAELDGEKILITGPAGQIAFPLAERLARKNDVWGIARFSDASTRERCDKVGITTRAVDLGKPDWGDLPDDFTLLLHLAAVIVPGLDFDSSINVNASGTGRVMSRFRNVRAAVVMSTCGVYASPEDPHHLMIESDPLGGSPQPYAPTYCVSKITQEAVARFAAEEFGIPTTLARMNAAYGDNGGLPAMLVEMVLSGATIPITPGRAPICSPIHEDDIYTHTAGLVDAASVPATITNWGGDEPVDMRDICTYIGEIVGREAVLAETDEGIHQYALDSSFRTQLTGPCAVPWKEGVRRMIAARHPEISLS